MALLASHVRMRTGQREVAAVVIEIDIIPTGRIMAEPSSRCHIDRYARHPAGDRSKQSAGVPLNYLVDMAGFTGDFWCLPSSLNAARL